MPCKKIKKNVSNKPCKSIKENKIEIKIHRCCEVSVEIWCCSNVDTRHGFGLKLAGWNDHHHHRGMLCFFECLGLNPHNSTRIGSHIFTFSCCVCSMCVYWIVRCFPLHFCFDTDMSKTKENTQIQPTYEKNKSEVCRNAETELLLSLSFSSLYFLNSFLLLTVVTIMRDQCLSW